MGMFSLLLAVVAGLAHAATLSSLGEHVDNTYIRELNADPEMDAHEPNQSPREVSSGHYVLVPPTPLPQPYLIICSTEAAKMLESTGRFVQKLILVLNGAPE